MEKTDVQKIISWIRDYFDKNSWAKGAILGMSGGKDSLVVAKLCAEALGKDRVLGIIMPNGNMLDIDDATKSCKIIGIDYKIVDISSAYNDILNISSPVIKEKGEKKTKKTDR